MFLSQPSPLPVLGTDVTVATTRGELLPYANLDIAASAPCAVAAATAVSELLPHYASVHRGAGALSQRCTQRYEQARRTVFQFLGGRAGDQVVFTRNTTDALNLLAGAVPEQTTVVTFVGEHHANLLPWRRVARLPLPDTPTAAVEAVDRALRQHRRAVVALTGASNVTGELWPIAEIGAVTRRHGARLVVDAAQLAAHRPVSLADLGADYIAVSGHKLYAPFGVGVLAGRADWLDAADPYLRGGGASAHVDGHGTTEWVTGPARHEAGTPNVVGAAALAAVCAALTPARWAALTAREESLLRRLREGLAAIPGVHELGLFPSSEPRVGIVSFASTRLDSATLARRLSDEYGIGVRDGLFCAHPLTRHLLRDQGLPTTAVRASIGAGTTDEHVTRVVDAVRTLTRPGPAVVGWRCR